MSKNSFTIDNPAEKGWIEDEDGRWIWSGSSYPNAEDLEVDTRHVLLDSTSKSMLPEGVSTQSDANRVVLAHLDTIFDEVGEIGDLHTKGNVQAADFLDSEGNSIIGASDGEQYWQSRDELTIEATKSRVHTDRTTTNVTQNLVQYTHGTIHIGTLDDWVDAEIDDPDMNIALAVMKMKYGENQPTLQIKKDGKLWNKGIEADEHIIGDAVRAYSELNFQNTVITQGGLLVDYDGNYQPADEDIGGVRQEIANPYYYLKTVDGEQVYTWKFNIPVQAPEYLDADGNSIIGGGGGGESLWTENDDGSIARVGASDYALAIGNAAGIENQERFAVALGSNAGTWGQGEGAVSLGYSAGQENQGEEAVAIGRSGCFNQGHNAIAIGTGAGEVDQGAHGIIISTNYLDTVGSNSTVEGHLILKTTKGSLNFNGTDKWTFDGGPVQASDFLDADGNSIIGAGGGGGSQELPEGFTRDEGLPSDKFSRGIVLGGVYSIASKSAIACPVNWQGKVAGINRLYGGIVISDKPGLWTSSMGVGLPSDLLSGAEGGEIELAASLFAMGDLLVVVTLPTDADGNASAAPRMYWTADGHHWSDVKASYQTIGEEVGLPPMDIDPDNILISIPEVAGINIPVFYDRTNQFFFALARHHGVGGAITGAQWSFIPLNENPIPESDLTTDGDPFLNQAKLDMSYTYNMVVVRNRFPKDKIWILNNLSYTTTIEPDEGYRLSQCVPVDGLGVIVSQYKNEGDSNSGTHHYRVDYYCKDGQLNSALTKRQRLHDSTYDYSNEGQDQYYTTPFRPDITVGRLSESRALLSLCAYGNYGAGLGPHTHLYISREGKGPYEAPTVEVYPDTSGGKFHRGQSYNSDRYSLLTDQGDLIWCTGWDTEYELNRVAWEGRPNELKFDGRAVKTHDPKQIWKL